MRFLALILALLAAAPAQAVILFPRGYAGRVDGALHEALIVHGDGRQETALRVSLQISGTTEAPGSLVWVIPVYGERTGFKLLDAAPFAEGSDLHDRLLQLAAQQWAARTDFTVGVQPDLPPSSAPDVDVPSHGMCTIAATSGSDGAINEINAWLGAHGFDHLGPAFWFHSPVSPSYVWVHVANPPMQGGRIGLPAVQIGQVCEAAVYPLKPAAVQGEFELSLTVLSAAPVDFEQLSVARARVGAVSTDRVPLHNLWSVQPLPAVIAPMAAGLAPARWFVNRIYVSGVNRAGATLADPDEPLTLGMGDLEDELPGFWYYADREVSLPERVFREHALALFVGGSMTILVVVVLKGRQNRRRAMASHHTAAREAVVPRPKGATGSAGPTGPSRHP